jgi:N-acetyl-alpha-D-muramate 1-phosphate uridylyltransferase
MQCLILAGGLGTRMREISGELPKALLPLGPQTFIDWQLQWLKLLGVTDVVLAIGHGGDAIRDHIEAKQTDSVYPQVNYSFDGPKLLGTGGAVKKAAPLLSKDFIVTYGDTFLSLRVRDLIKAHLDGGKPLTFGIIHNKNQGDKSNVVYRNSEIIKYDKVNRTAEMEYIDYGMSVFNKAYFLENTPDGAFDLADFMTSVCQKKLVTPFVADLMFQEVGSPEGYRTFATLLKENDYDLKAIAKQRNLI